MKKENLILVKDFCRLYNVELSFVKALNEYELIEVITVKGTGFIDKNDLSRLEKLVRMHYDLDINVEGIDVISNLLDRIESMQQEMMGLKNRLRRFEEG